MPAQSESFGVYLVRFFGVYLALGRVPLYHLSDGCQVRSCGDYFWGDMALSGQRRKFTLIFDF